MSRAFGAEARPPGGRIRVLIARSLPLLIDGKPVQPIDFWTEERRLRQVLMELASPVDVAFLADGSTRAVQVALDRGVNVLVLSCHGLPNGQLVFEDEYGGAHPLQPFQFLALFPPAGSHVPGPEIAVLLGCHTERIGRALVGAAEDHAKASSGDARPCAVIAFDERSPLIDTFAIAYLPAFLAALARGDTVSVANEAGRRAADSSDHARSACSRLGVSLPAYVRKFRVLMGEAFRYENIDPRAGSRIHAPPSSPSPPGAHVPTRLPGEPWFGRERDVIEINRILTDPRHPHHGAVVTIAGAPGIGKTSLASEVAGWQQARRRWAAVVWLSLESGRGGEAIVGLLCRAAGVPLGEPENRVDRLVEALREAAILLVLDNLETLASPDEDPEDLRALLDLLDRIAEPSRILLTSRRDDLYPRGTVYRLKGLEAEDGGALLLRTAARPGGGPSDRFETRAVQDLCGFFGGNPLAIRLVGEKIAATGADPSALLEGIRKRGLVLLEQRGRHGPTRLRDLEFSLDLTVRSPDFPEEAYRLLQALSAFHGGADPPAMDAVIGEAIPGWFWDAMPELRNLGLVVERRSDGRPRWSLHPYIREYARRLPGGDAEAWSRRHADYFLDCAMRCDREGSHDAIEGELPNVIAALRWCIGGGHHDLTVRFGLALRRFFVAREHLDTGLRYLQAGLEAARAGDDAESEIVFLHELGRLCARRGDHERARGFFESNLKAAEAAGDRTVLAVTLHMLGNIDLYAGDRRSAKDRYRRSLQIVEDLGDEEEIAANLIALGLLAASDGRTRRAEGLLERGLALALKMRDLAHVASAEKGLGQVCMERRKFKEARTWYERCRKTLEVTGDEHEEADLECLFGRCHRDSGALEEAAAHYERAVELARRLGDRRTECLALRGLGMIALARGALRRAGERLQDGMRLSREIGSRPLAADLHLHLALIHRAAGELEEARRRCEEGMRACEEQGDDRRLAWANLLLAEILRDLGDEDGAARARGDGLRLAEQLEAVWTGPEPTERDLRP